MVSCVCDHTCNEWDKNPGGRIRKKISEANEHKRVIAEIIYDHEYIKRP
jgi:hypothetical protein